MAESLRAKIVPVLVSAGIGLILSLFGLSRQAGALEQRVTDLERTRTQLERKLDESIKLQWETREAVNRIEGRLRRSDRER